MNKLSVLVPLYNHEQFIGECLDSILASDYPLEVVVADDCSTDNSYEVVRLIDSFSKRVKLIRREENGGTPAALNTCLRAISDSKYIAVVASDDYIAPDHFSNLVRHLELHNLDSCYSNYVYINEDSRVTRLIETPMFDYESLTERCNIPLTTSVTRIEIMQEWDEKCISSEDWELMLRIYNDARVGKHPSDRGYYYRVRNADGGGHLGKCFKHTQDGTLREVHNYIVQKHNLRKECSCGHC